MLYCLITSIVFIFFFPFLIRCDLYYSKCLGKVLYRISMFNFLKINGGYISANEKGIIIHIKNKLVRGKNLAFIIIPACIFAVLSSFLSNHLKNQLLSKIFGGFLIFLALLQFFLDKVKKKKQK